MQQDSHQSDTGKLGIGVAILIGQLFVNFPVIVIMFGSFWLGLLFLGNIWWISLVIGFVGAWLWWSYTLPYWRSWAVQNGAQPDKLHRAAVATGLEWPKGSIFEKTEIKPK